MSLTGAMADLAAALDGVGGLRAYPFVPDTLAIPAAVVQLPVEIVYQGSGGPAPSYRVEVALFVSRGHERASHERLAGMLDPAGAASAVAAIDGAAGTNFDSAHVERARGVGPLTMNGVEYLGAILVVDLLVA